MSKAEKDKVIRAKRSAAAKGDYKRSSKSNVKGARKKGAACVIGNKVTNCIDVATGRTMRKILITVAATLFISCASTKIVQTKDITSQATWLDSSEHNPIVNVIQKQYANDDKKLLLKKN